MSPVHGSSPMVPLTVFFFHPRSHGIFLLDSLSPTKVFNSALSPLSSFVFFLAYLFARVPPLLTTSSSFFVPPPRTRFNPHNLISPHKKSLSPASLSFLPLILSSTPLLVFIGFVFFTSIILVLCWIVKQSPIFIVFFLALLLGENLPDFSLSYSSPPETSSASSCGHPCATIFFFRLKVWCFCLRTVFPSISPPLPFFGLYRFVVPNLSFTSSVPFRPKTVDPTLQQLCTFFSFFFTPVSGAKAN